MFNWKLKATNAIYLEDGNGQEGRPFKSRFLQAGLVKYDFGVCLLKKETIDKFVNTFVECPVIIDHKDNLTDSDRVGTIQKIWFSADDGWFWCSGIITDEKAIDLIENGYNVSCQYRITDYIDNEEGKLHNANPYDKEILDGVFEHLAIVENPRYEDAFIAVNAYIAKNNDFKENDHPRDDEGKFTDGNGINPNYKEELKQVIEKAKKNPNERQKLVIGKVSDKLQEKAKENGFNISGYSHDLDVSGTRHAIKGHSNEKTEEKRGQIGLTDKDFEQIPDIIYNFDNVTFGEEDSKGTPLVKYQKTFQDGTTIYIEEIRSRQKTLTIKTMYKTKKASNSRTFTDLNPQRQEYTSNIIIAYNSDDFNPNITINKETNKYNKVFDYIRNTKGESMDNETKGLFSAFLDVLKARNEADDEKEKDKEDEKAANEYVDKRKLIDEVGGILKSKVDEEVWRTIIGKIEKVAYDKSSTGTADNSKAKNEDDDEKKASNEDVDKRDIIRRIMAIAGKHEDNEEVRTIAKLAEKLAYDKSEAGTADNSKCKNSEEEKLYEELKEKIEKDAENKKAKNSLDALVNQLYKAAEKEFEPAYISPKKGIELGEQIYGR